MAKLKLPFELEKPSANEYVTKTSEIGHNGEPLDEVLEGLGNIPKESTQSEEQAIIYETDGGVQVGKIDANGADFTNLKRGGQQVARMSDLPTVPTLDTSIGSSPSNSHTPSTKAVKDYVDDNIPEVPDYPIETESTSSDTEEQVWGNNAETQEYAKIGSYGMKSKAYLDMNGNNVILTKDTSIGDSPSQTNVPTSKAVADYVEAHGGGMGDLPISEESTQSEDEEFVASNDAGTDIYTKIGSYGIKAKAYFDLSGNPIGGGNQMFAASPLQIIEACAAKITTKDTGNTTGAARHEKLVVAHITDTHGDTTRMTNFVNFLNANSIVDFGIHSGDVDRANIWVNMVDACSKPIFLAIGNHEGDSYVDTGTFNASLKTNYFPTAVTNKMGVIPSEHNYYYVDNNDYGNNIRFIVLNEYDYPDGVVSADLSAVNGMYNGIYSQTQIDWLVNTLKDCATNGYYAVIVSHQKPAKVIKNNSAFYQDVDALTQPNKNYTGDVIGDIVDAYKKGTAINKSYAATSSVSSILPTVTVNTTFSGNGKFIAYINGHNHGDYIGYSSTHSDQLILNSTLASANRFIVSGGSKPGERLYSDLPRNTDDDTQDCYNVYIFDIEDSCVHVVRIGSNLNVNFKLRKYEKYTF